MGPLSREPRFTLVLGHPGALRGMLLVPTERALGEAYVRGDCDIEGDLEAALATFAPVLESLWRAPVRALALAGRLLLSPRPERADTRTSEGSPEAAAEAGPPADRVGSDFYELWLDRHMQHASARFETGEEDLDTAQEAQLESICRGLELRPGDHLLDIGCAWGGLIRYAATRHGVRATGLAPGRARAARARRAIAAEELDDRCTVEIRDPRELPAETRFDAVVSVETVDRIGRTRLPEYFETVHRLLPPDGPFLNTGVVRLDTPRGPLGRARERLPGPRTSFIGRHLFPDVEPVTPAERIGAAEEAGFETRSVESLRGDYALTLRRWVDRLEANRRAAVERAGERTYRAWRLYMAGSAHAFDTGRIGITQELYRRR